MSFIHPDVDTVLQQSNASMDAVLKDQHIVEKPANETEKLKNSTAMENSTMGTTKLEIKIILVKNMAIDSPLLPITEGETSEKVQNNNNNNKNNNNNNIIKSYISTKPLSFDAYSPSAAFSLHERRYSIGNPLQLPTDALPSININGCRRRSSITSPYKFETASVTFPIFIETEDIDDYTNFPSPKSYSTPSSAASLSPNFFNRYPKDSFENLEGTAPKPFTKMQSKFDAVGRVTGQWGKWQLRTVLLIFLCKIPSSWFMACIIFTAPAPRHGEFFCKPPNTVGAQNQTSWIKVSHPQKEEADDEEFSIDFCNVYQDAQEHAHHYYRYDQPELEPKIWEEPSSRNATNIIPCNEFHHEADFQSVITQYDLVCSRDILVSVTQFFHLFGVLTGGILANHLLKYFSPRNVMLFGMITQIFCGNLTGHVASYELHVFFRCLSAVCCAQMYTAGGMIMGDITGGKYKTCVSTLFEQFWSIGVILLPGVASFFSSWSYLYMAISWPTVILIYLWQWIPDSPRWMIARGRVLEAKKILLECAEVNGTRNNLPQDIDVLLQLQAQTAMDAPPPAGWWSIWKGKKAVRHMVCVHLCWSIYIVVYYGMLLNIRSFSREHLEINTIVAGLSEIIGTFIGLFLILKTTRKWLWTGLFNIVAGLIAYLGWLVPHNIPIDARVALLMLSAMVSKVAISTTLSILTTCTVELVSDEKKKICAFSTICWARFWLLGAPFIGALIIFGQLIPQTIFASLAIFGGILTTLISSPRTINKHRSPVSNMTEGVENKGFAAGPGANVNNHNIYPNISKMPTKHTNLPPQLTPGIWTTKYQEDMHI